MEGSSDPNTLLERLELDLYRGQINDYGIRFKTAFNIDAAGLISNTFNMVVKDVKFFPKPHYIQNIHLNIYYDLRFNYYNYNTKKITAATVSIYRISHVIFSQICFKLDYNIYLIFLDLY
jgi:hypothetical protein